MTRGALEGGNGVLHGKGDNLVKFVTQCTITEAGAVVVLVHGSDIPVKAFDTMGAPMAPDEVVGLTVIQARELRDSRLKA